MSEQNVELVRAGFRAYADRDLDALMAIFTADVEWRLIGGFAGLMGEEFKGQAALRGFFVDWVKNLGGSGEVETILDADDRVVAVVRTEGAGGTSGAPAAFRWGQVYAFRDGLIARVDNYYEASEALAAVGLRDDAVSSDEDIALVTRAFSAYAAGDVEALLAVLDTDVEIKSLMTEAERAIYQGHEGAREWLAAIHEVFPDWRPTVTCVRTVRGGVVTEFVADATAIGSGVRIEQTYWHATQIRDGKVTWFGFFRTEPEAVEALDGVA